MRVFDAVDDQITLTMAAIDSGDWTMGVCGYANSTGENSAGRAITVETSGGTLRQDVSLVDAGGGSIGVRGRQSHATTTATTTSTTTLGAGTLYVLFATFRASDSKVRLYYASLTAAPVEMSYSAQTAGSGARETGGVNGIIGNGISGARTWDGGLEGAFMDAREWTLPEMARFWMGKRPITQGGLRFYLPLNSPTAATCQDWSGQGATGTLSGATVGTSFPRVWKW